MLTTFILAFREFLEAFLLIGLFLGISKKMSLGKGKEIILAALVGLALSLVLPTIVFIFGAQAQRILSEKNADLLEGYLLSFSGLFVAYVVFALHHFMAPKRNAWVKKVKDQMVEKEIFDVTLFLMIVFFIAREGFEIAILTATTSLFTVFTQNLFGLLLGFAAGGIVGTLLYLSMLKVPVKRIFQVTEYTIVIFGAAMVKNGLSNLVANYSKFRIENVIPIKLSFIPPDTTIFGHLLKNLFGIEKQLSVASLSIMAAYIAAIYFLFFYKKSPAKRLFSSFFKKVWTLILITKAKLI